MNWDEEFLKLFEIDIGNKMFVNISKKLNELVSGWCFIFLKEQLTIISIDMFCIYDQHLNMFLIIYLYIFY